MSENTTTPTARDWATKFGIKAYRYRALVKRRWWILAVAVSLGSARGVDFDLPACAL